MDKISLSFFIVWATQTNPLDLLLQYVKLKKRHFWIFRDQQGIWEDQQGIWEDSLKI